ncbi:MAG: hypothetical protein NTW86_11875 [Candidatus Sumerlaeota bacterium]|nr:hypothetical protein [Candidatus Sumerlaeota bacterium]
MSDPRLIEDYLPIQAISAEASREKSVRKASFPWRITEEWLNKTWSGSAAVAYDPARKDLDVKFIQAACDFGQTRRMAGIVPFFGWLFFDYEEWRPTKGTATDLLTLLNKRNPSFFEYKKAIEANRGHVVGR